jgi:hypothetical protein
MFNEFNIRIVVASFGERQEGCVSHLEVTRSRVFLRAAAFQDCLRGMSPQDERFLLANMSIMHGNPSLLSSRPLSAIKQNWWLLSSKS